MSNVYPEIPASLRRPGLVWGKGDGVLYAYAETRNHLSGIPDSIDGCKVIKKVTGKVKFA